MTEDAAPLRIGVIIGSTRPGRIGPGVAAWAERRARSHPGVTAVRLDLAEFDLPLFDEPQPPAMWPAQHAHTRAWAEAVAACDGFIFVAPEYNRSLPGALKNAIDFLFHEWRDKVAGIVGYGVNGGVRAAEHLRLVLAELSVADVRTAVALDLFDDFEDGSPAPSPRQEDNLQRLLAELVRWGRPLRELREQGPG